VKRHVKHLLAVFGMFVVVGVGVACWSAFYKIVDITNYHDPPEEIKFVDDKLEDKNPTFDETLIDSRPLGELGDWQVNKSAAVIKLDCPIIKPDSQTSLLSLHKSYTNAINAAMATDFEFLPSANLLDGAAKQFDDGLYAAIDLAVFRGELGVSSSVPDFLLALFEESSKSSPARPFLAAALELGGKQVELTQGEEKQKGSLLDVFNRTKAVSQPISFYNWTPDLQQVWRCLRFLQFEFGQLELEVPRAVASVLENNVELLKQYRSLNGFYATLTNPAISLSVDALIGNEQDVRALAKQLGVSRDTVSVFPPSTSRETELFDRLFDAGLPAGANLMATLIQHIRSGKVDLAPRKTSG